MTDQRALGSGLILLPKSFYLSESTLIRRSTGSIPECNCCPDRGGHTYQVFVSISKLRSTVQKIRLVDRK